MKYEYELLQIPLLGQDREIEVLNNYGEDGWMVVDVEHDYREGQRRYLLTRWVPTSGYPVHEKLTSQATDVPRRPIWARG